jgi:hypothetical protein
VRASNHNVKPQIVKPVWRLRDAQAEIAQQGEAYADVYIGQKMPLGGIQVETEIQRQQHDGQCHQQ